MCDSEATSREHAPPKSIFPELRDVGQDFRKELITVPSCDAHNSSKSKDDEFLMVSLAGIVGNNSIGYQHKLTKVDRAVRRTANRLLNNVFIKKPLVKSIELDRNKYIEILWGNPDIERLNSCFNNIARALHHHYFGYRFVGEVKAHLDFLFYDDVNIRTLAKLIRDKSAIDLANKPNLGSNPSIFYYQVSDFDESGLFMMKLCFYGGVNIYVSFIHIESKSLFNLSHYFINNGIETICTLGNTEYIFNNDK